MPKAKPEPRDKPSEWKPSANGFALWGMCGNAYRILGRIIPDDPYPKWKVYVTEGARVILDQEEITGLAKSYGDATEIVEFLSEKLAKLYTEKTREGMGKLK